MNLASKLTVIINRPNPVIKDGSGYYLCYEEFKRTQSANSIWVAGIMHDDTTDTMMFLQITPGTAHEVFWKWHQLTDADFGMK
ncbi:hypothetical protein C6P08_06930 [Weissella confusa]|uniref:hypothetical protein n=1 Tax=Weissella TaxID=46255 RepID=UPI00109335FB|nr:MULTISPECIES: hypothetical protein [Weissella]MBJ7694299.1 hypothetical protein [Weissella confusa]NFA03607.1 hypothetical protein [Weissella cibaria]QBZ04930.1 hypothetical protein C6P08_06930 [Weissella confusa]